MSSCGADTRLIWGPGGGDAGPGRPNRPGGISATMTGSSDDEEELDPIAQLNDVTEALDKDDKFNKLYQEGNKPGEDNDIEISVDVLQSKTDKKNKRTGQEVRSKGGESVRPCRCPGKDDILIADGHNHPPQGDFDSPP